MEIQIEKASKEHLSALLALCREASSTPHSTWDEYYPNEEILLEDIESSRLYLILYGSECVGVSALGDIGELSDFAETEDGDRPMELARLAILPRFQGQGFAKAAVHRAVHMAKEADATVLRLLVATDNPNALAVYRDAGFTLKQTVFLYDNDYYYAKRLISEGEAP